MRSQRDLSRNLLATEDVETHPRSFEIVLAKLGNGLVLMQGHFECLQKWLIITDCDHIHNVRGKLFGGHWFDSGHGVPWTEVCFCFLDERFPLTPAEDDLLPFLRLWVHLRLDEDRRQVACRLAKKILRRTVFQITQPSVHCCSFGKHLLQ